VTRGPATDLVLVRHGETSYGEGALIDGQLNPPLSNIGREQARQIAERLGGEDVTALFVTPFLRTVETAWPLVERSGLATTVVPELREVHLGELEARLGSLDGRREVMREVLRQARWDVVSDAEPADVFADRVAAGIAELATAVGPGGRAVAFVHGGVIAEACRQATGSRPLAFVPHLRNASITRLHYRSDELSLTVFNDIAHLAS